MPEAQAVMQDQALMQEQPRFQGVLDQRQVEMLRRVRADGSLLRKAVDAFLIEMPANLSALDKALKLYDPPGLRHAAHRLRGAAANLGATTVAALCAELEHLGAEEDLERAPILLLGLEAEIDRAGVALREAARTSAP